MESILKALKEIMLYGIFGILLMGTFLFFLKILVTVSF